MASNDVSHKVLLSV